MARRHDASRCGRSSLASAALVTALTVALAAPGTTPAAQAGPDGATVRLVPDDDAVRRLAPDLQARLASDAYVYFRFINVPWERAACEQFRDVLPSLPPVHLHGDPHLEQYAFTATGRGLDDFDDSSTGPFVLDLTRFVASVRLALRARGWNDAAPRAIDAFFEGYRAALVDAAPLPPEPTAIARLRASRPRSPEAFLAWAESLMLPLDPAYGPWLPHLAETVDALARRARPGLPAGYFRIKKAGRLTMGVGSALTTKALLRFEGPTSREDDDVVVEAKHASDLRGVPCLTVAPSPAFRVVTGAEHIGRLQHEWLMVLPRLDPARRTEPESWWLRSWDATYREVDIADYVSAEELVEVARDVGWQLGRGHFGHPPGSGAPEGRILLEALEGRIRHVVDAQTARLLADWAAFAAARAGR